MFVSKLEELCVQRSSDNTSINNLSPPIMPIEIAEMNISFFFRIFHMQREL